jgi:hypothetical protein
MIDDLKIKIDLLYDDMEALEEEIDAKDEIIRELEARLYAMKNNKPQQQRPKNQHYIPVKGDEVDERLADYINTYGSPVPWTRLSHKNYTYGSKKVNVKYMRQHLIIKVGGGSMMVEEFVANYEDIELAKMNYFNPDKKFVNSDASIAGLTKQQRVAMARGVSAVARGSPRAGGSPRTAADRNKAANAMLSNMEIKK